MAAKNGSVAEQSIASTSQIEPTIHPILDSSSGSKSDPKQIGKTKSEAIQTERKHFLSHNKKKKNKRKKKKNIKCDRPGCRYIAKDRHYLKSHLLSHSLKPYDCDQCNESFNYKKDLKRHMRTRHVDQCPDNPLLVCDWKGCQYNTKSLDRLDYHKRIHNLPFMCQLCGKEFFEKRYLSRHSEKYHSRTQEFTDEVNRMLDPKPKTSSGLSTVKENVETTANTSYTTGKSREIDHKSDKQKLTEPDETAEDNRVNEKIETVAEEIVQKILEELEKSAPKVEVKNKAAPEKSAEEVSEPLDPNEESMSQQTDGCQALNNDNCNENKTKDDPLSRIVQQVVGQSVTEPTNDLSVPAVIHCTSKVDPKVIEEHVDKEIILAKDNFDKIGDQTNTMTKIQLKTNYNEPKMLFCSTCGISYDQQQMIDLHIKFYHPNAKIKEALNDHKREITKITINFDDSDDSKSTQTRPATDQDNDPRSLADRLGENSGQSQDNCDTSSIVIDLSDKDMTPEDSIVVSKVENIKERDKIDNSDKVDKIEITRMKNNVSEKSKREVIVVNTARMTRSLAKKTDTVTKEDVELNSDNSKNGSVVEQPIAITSIIEPNIDPILDSLSGFKSGPKNIIAVSKPQTSKTKEREAEVPKLNQTKPKSTTTTATEDNDQSGHKIKCLFVDCNETFAISSDDYHNHLMTHLVSKPKKVVVVCRNTDTNEVHSEDNEEEDEEMEEVSSVFSIDKQLSDEEGNAETAYKRPRTIIVCTNCKVSFDFQSQFDLHLEYCQPKQQSSKTHFEKVPIEDQSTGLDSEDNTEYEEGVPIEDLGANVDIKNRESSQSEPGISAHYYGLRSKSSAPNSQTKVIDEDVGESESIEKDGREEMRPDNGEERPENNTKLHCDSLSGSKSVPKQIRKAKSDAIRKIIKHSLSYKKKKKIKCDRPGCHYMGYTHLLRAHLLRHSSWKPYDCDHCEKSFKSKADLRYHMRTRHMDQCPDDRLLVCDWNGCQFYTKSLGRMNQHKRIHTLPLKCLICGKSFSRDHHLSRHSKKYHSNQ